MGTRRIRQPYSTDGDSKSRRRRRTQGVPRPLWPAGPAPRAPHLALPSPCVALPSPAFCHLVPVPGAVIHQGAIPTVFPPMSPHFHSSLNAFQEELSKMQTGLSLVCLKCFNGSCPLVKTQAGGRGQRVLQGQGLPTFYPLSSGHNSLLPSHLATSSSFHVLATASRKPSLLLAKPLLFTWPWVLSSMTGPCPPRPPVSLRPTTEPRTQDM